MCFCNPDIIVLSSDHRQQEPKSRPFQCTPRDLILEKCTIENTLIKLRLINIKQKIENKDTTPSHSTHVTNTNMAVKSAQKGKPPKKPLGLQANFHSSQTIDNNVM